MSCIKPFPEAFEVSKLLLESEEGSLSEGIRVHGLLVNVLGNNHQNEIKLLCANQQRPFRELPQGKKNFREPSAAAVRRYLLC